MIFFSEIARLVFDSLPWAIVSYLPFFLLLVAILIARRRKIERAVLGINRVPFWREIAHDALIGIAAGYIGSLALIYLGIALDTAGFLYVLLLAILLFFMDPHYLCLAYAGGFVSLISLATGLPRLHIPGLLALVAVLHITESALILIDGDRQAIPIYLKHPKGTIGGCLLQRIWPVPLIALSAIVAAGQKDVTYLHSPAWWPLIPMSLGATMALIYTAIPVAAALGYEDLALTSSPRIKALRTAGLLFLYSLILLALAVASARFEVFAWLAALFAPCGHELTLYATRQIELRGRPAYTNMLGGVKILAILPESRAAKAGLKPGETIAAVNNQPVRTKAELLLRLGESIILTSIDTMPRKRRPGRQYEFRGDARQLGLVLAPDLDEPAQVEVCPWRFLSKRKET